MVKKNVSCIHYFSSTMKDHSKLFNKEGYILLKDYIDDIAHMQKYGPWKVPLSLMDKAQLFFLSLVVKFSWFSKYMYIQYENAYSPAYSIIINYLKKKRIFDEVLQKDSFAKGFSYFNTIKKLSINNHTLISKGSGIDTNIEIALSKSIGESIERMISGVYDANKKVVSLSSIEMQKKYKLVYPPKYHRFLKVQLDAYREIQHDPNNIIEWVKGINLITKENTYIPRQMTSWLGYGSSRIFREKLIDQTSNGCAGYFTKEGATLRALLEGVSRDGFLVHWLTVTAPNVISQDSLPEDLQRMIDDFASRGITICLLDVKSLSIPSVYVVAINYEADVPMLVLAGAAGTTYKEALYAGLLEMVMLSRVFYFDKKPEKLQGEPKPFVSAIDKSTRLSYWQGEERINEFKWFISGKKVLYKDICLSDIGEGADSDTQKLQECLTVLQTYGEECYPVVYYPKHKVQDALGFYVAQVYIPKAFPFYLRECYGTFDSDRLSDFAKSKNIKDWKLNEKPHMFD